MMEQLTEHHVNKSLGAYIACSAHCEYTICDVSCEGISKIVDRLAAYEDTGLEPEEITMEPYGCVFYCNRKCNLDGDFCAEGPGCPYEVNAVTAKHLLELAQAEKDGRLVVLPCKPGDAVYFPLLGKIIEKQVFSIVSFSNSTKIYCSGTSEYFRPEDIGKTFFLTREEAEAALKKREDVDYEQG